MRGFAQREGLTLVWPFIQQIRNEMVRAVLSVMLGTTVVRRLFMWPVGMVKSLLFKEMFILYQMGLFVLVFLSLVFSEGVGTTFDANKWKEPPPPAKVSSFSLQKGWKRVTAASSPLSSVFWKCLFYVEALSALAVLSSRKRLLIC